MTFGQNLQKSLQISGIFGSRGADGRWCEARQNLGELRVGPPMRWSGGSGRGISATSENLPMDPIPNDAFLELAEIDFSNGEQRWLIDGERPFEDGRRRVVRMVMVSGNVAREVTAGLRSDSDVTQLVPVSDLDSRDMAHVEMHFYTGERNVVLMRARDPLPRDVAARTLSRVGQAYREADWERSDYHDLGRDLRYLGLGAVRERTRQIEQSVRDALEDEHVSSRDYAALRSYPARLAIVEELAAKLRAEEPEVRSYEPKGPFPVIGPIQADFLFKHIDEAAEDAREAVARLSGLIASQQVVLTQRQAAETARFQRMVTIVGAAVLVPGLVAAIFGANVGFQGRNSSADFWAMLLLMAGSGIGSYALLRWLESAQWQALRQRKPLSLLAEMSTERQLVGLAAIAAVAIAAGIMLIASSGSPRGGRGGNGSTNVSRPAGSAPKVSVRRQANH
jgi:hypothetical protein